MSKLRLACAAWEITAPGSMAEFAAKLDGVLAEARAGGAELLLLPEYMAMELAFALGAAGDAAAELAVICDAAPEILALYCAGARRHGLWLQPGSLPMRRGAGVVNCAPLISPQGAVAWQEKRVMTRFEAEEWGVSPGAAPGVFETPWGRVGIAICYDVEFPGLVRAQVEAGAWLILAPSCTDGLAGHYRVQISARARALENQCFVAVAATVGSAAWLASVDENHGQAAVFGPVDRGFAHDGLVASIALDKPGLVFADLDPARLAAVRQDGAVRNNLDWPAAVPASPILFPE